MKIPSTFHLFIVCDAARATFHWFSNPIPNNLTYWSPVEYNWFNIAVRAVSCCVVAKPSGIIVLSTNNKFCIHCTLCNISALRLVFLPQVVVFRGFCNLPSSFYLTFSSFVCFLSAHSLSFSLILHSFPSWPCSFRHHPSAAPISPLSLSCGSSSPSALSFAILFIISLFIPLNTPWPPPPHFAALHFSLALFLQKTLSWAENASHSSDSTEFEDWINQSATPHTSAREVCCRQFHTKSNTIHVCYMSNKSQSQ